MPSRSAPRRKEETAAAITLDDVRRLAGLSRLTISASDEEKLIREFSAILDYFRVVDEVVATVETPAARGPNVVRPDVPAPSDPEGVLKGVPRRKGRLVRAPRVF